MALHPPRDYQVELKHGIYRAWQSGARNVLAVLPTGGGKTYVFSTVVGEINRAVAVVAHRAELVTQMSLALAREGVRHRVIGSDAVQRRCSSEHMDELKRSYVEPNARVAACSVDTLVKLPPSDPWPFSVGLWVMDEAHHVLKDNKWGRACQMFPNALGLGVTATPTRADGKGLGKHADGLFETMVVGPSMRELINREYLTDYRIFAPPNNLDLSGVNVTASGDYSPEKLAQARRKSCITGNVVQHYLKHARGKLGVTFDVDVESATETAKAFRDAGVPAEVVHGNTSTEARFEIMRRFKRREILQLVNVDLFGEGTDVPAIEVVSFARPTQSYGLFVQQFGRALRLLDGKQWAIIIDHVGNVERHGLPDAAREWSLDRRERRSRKKPDDVIPIKICLKCTAAYEAVHRSCPFCGEVRLPAGRSTPEQVEGDLVELDPSVLARMRGEIARVDGAPVIPPGVAPEVAGAMKKNHWNRQQAQAELRRQIALWAGWQTLMGRSDDEAYRRFWIAFGYDVMTAQTLNAADASELTERVKEVLTRNNVVEAR